MCANPQACIHHVLMQAKSQSPQSTPIEYRAKTEAYDSLSKETVELYAQYEKLQVAFMLQVRFMCCIYLSHL